MTADNRAYPIGYYNGTYTENTTGVIITPTITYPPLPTTFDPSEWRFYGSVVTMESERKEDPNMRYLYVVYVVDPDRGELAWAPSYVVAQSERAAERKIVAKDFRPEVDTDEFDFIIVKLGEVRPKKEVQEVKVVE